VLDYLLAALETPDCQGKIFEIGGPDKITYAESLLEYARQRGLKRWLITFPIIPVWLMAYWVDKLTPVPMNIAAPLIDGMRSDSVVGDTAAQQIFPQIHPLDYRSAVVIALSQLSPAHIEPVWSSRPSSVIKLKHAGFLIDFRKISVKAPPAAVYQIFTGLGGKNGWLYLDGLWKLRGLLDSFLGGPGMRGRQAETDLQLGQVIDYYHVEALEPGQMLRLRSDLKAFGEGWMEWQVKPQPAGGALLSQVAYFAPKGLPGFLYWYILSPLHHLVFAGLIKKIARRAMRTPPLL
jgi:hypothetical protein